jgi:nucleotide-binding universal stress UspA family protein
MTSASPQDHHVFADAIVVGVDGSESSLQALEWAAEQARLTSRRLVAVTTWEWPATYSAFVGWPAEVHFEQHAARILHASVQKALGDSQTAGLTEKVIHGSAALVLVDASKAASLVVVGSRGHGEFTGMLLGSVGEYLTTHSRCPLVIVRRECAA